STRRPGRLAIQGSRWTDGSRHEYALASETSYGDIYMEGAPAPTRSPNSQRPRMTNRRNVIVHIATSADGYIARPDGDLEWLTSRPAPKGFYGMNTFMRSIDTKLLGRTTYDVSLRMGAKFDSNSRNIVFSRQTPPAHPPPG